MLPHRVTGAVALLRRPTARPSKEFFTERQVIMPGYIRKAPSQIQHDPRCTEMIRHQPVNIRARLGGHE